MNFQESIKGLHDPKNLYHQVDSVCFNVITYDDRENGEAYYEALGNLPDRVKAAALDCFKRGDARSYRAAVLRYALKRYEEIGWIDSSLPIVDVSDLPD